MDDYRTKFIEKWGEPLEEWKDHIKVKCPECSMNSLSCDTSTGLFFCFYCSFGKGERPVEGTPSESTQTTPIDYNLHLDVCRKIIEVSPLDSDHREYLKRRGIYNPEGYNLGTVQPQVHLLLKPFFSNEDLVKSGAFHIGSQGMSSSLHWRRLLIPFYFGTELVGIKTRSDPLNPMDAPRYGTLRGSRVGRTVYWLPPLEGDIVITEGELGAIAGREYGLSCIGLPGVGSSVSALRTLKSVLQKVAYKRVFIALDTDINPEAKSQSRRLAKKLAREISRAYVVELPPDSQDEKMDLDLYLVRHGVEAFLDLVEETYHKGDQDGSSNTNFDKGRKRVSAYRRNPSRSHSSSKNPQSM